jgi:hypothetical protein
MAALAGFPAHTLEVSLHEFGQRADNDTFQRVIRITPDTASVSVYRMETVKFVNAQTGKTFVWRFNTPHGENFALGQIAPPEFLDGQAVTAYVWDIPAPGTMLLLYLSSGGVAVG